ncbi:hypothetical protein BaRGS_00008932 [Batillaria attramentaria]|uniref:Secreted protein n=1 Tax=Batillaria attramentaria TaxID=370345 RepID=A0ABD0LJZ9_9CAEN
MELTVFVRSTYSLVLCHSMVWLGYLNCGKPVISQVIQFSAAVAVPPVPAELSRAVLIFVSCCRMQRRHQSAVKSVPVILSGPDTVGVTVTDPQRRISYFPPGSLRSKCMHC